MEQVIKDDLKKKGFWIGSLKTKDGIMLVPASAVVFDDGRRLEEIMGSREYKGSNLRGRLNLVFR